MGEGNRYAVIMAGGSGTRLWPLSRVGKPKQLLDLVDGRSLLQLCYERIAGLLPADRIYVCIAQADRDAVLANLPDLPPENVIGEPTGRDTANAIGYASAVLREADPDAVVAFLSSDHLIEPVDVFRGAVDRAYTLAEQPGALVTFGIVPTHPHIGLGYIELGAALPTDPAAHAVASFAEKPDAATAEGYVGSGRYLWNSGMFVWRADSVLDQLAAHLPTAYADLVRIAAAWRTPDRDAVLAERYPTLPKISIDYAVMEPASRQPGVVLVVPLEISWLDIGSWPSLAQILPTDAAGNALRALTAGLDASGCVLISDDPDHLIATIGVQDLVVVHTGDATLVCPRAEAERVKLLANQIAQQFAGRYS
ncbi:MAG: mannose-1-phosphate guanylyltransferase [Jatrophihabitans sp.]